jgi:DHA1 family bicyclomycin/chloramphenicol resistance-like MFS transporter
LKSTEPAAAPGATAALIWTLGLAVGLSALSIDLIAPALSAIRRSVATSAAMVGLTIPSFMLGFGVGQLGFGVLSDRYGRQRMLFWGIGLYTVATIGCALTSSAPVLLACRAIEGVGAGASVVIAGAVIRDLFEGRTALAVRSRVNVVYSVAPIAAPVIGAQIVSVVNWRMAFVALTACGLAVAVGAARLRRPHGARLTQTRTGLLAGYGVVLRERRFVTAALVNALSFGASFAAIAGAPLLLVVDRGISPPVYSLLFGCMAIGLSAGIWASAPIGGKVRSGLVLLCGLAVMVCAPGLETLLAWSGRGGIAAFVASSTVLLFARGVVAITAQHAAMEALHSDIGAGSSVIGFLQTGAATISSTVVALLFPLLGAAAVAGIATSMALLALAACLIG